MISPRALRRRPLGFASPTRPSPSASGSVISGSRLRDDHDVCWPNKALAACWLGGGRRDAAVGRFGFVTASARPRGIAASCNCFGPGSADAASLKALWRLMLLAAGVTLVLVANADGLAVAQAPLAANIVAGGCVLVAIAVALELPAALRIGERSTAGETSHPNEHSGERR